MIKKGEVVNKYLPLFGYEAGCTRLVYMSKSVIWAKYGYCACYNKDYRVHKTGAMISGVTKAVFLIGLVKHKKWGLMNYKKGLNELQKGA